METTHMHKARKIVDVIALGPARSLVFCNWDGRCLHEREFTSEMDATKYADEHERMHEDYDIEKGL